LRISTKVCRVCLARLKEKVIPLAARIFAVIAMWNVLLSDCPYRARWPKAKAREYI